jgi:hypothetical protein
MRRWTARADAVLSVLSVLSVFAAALALAAACRPAPPAAALAVEYAGCAEVLRDGPVCLLAADAAGKGGRLILWLPRSDLAAGARAGPGREPVDELDLRLDGRRLDPRRVPAGEGERLELDLPASGGRLVVRRVTARGEEAWSLRLAPRSPEPPWLRDAMRLAKSGRAGDLPRARDLLAAHLDGAPPALRPRVLGALARLPADEPQEARLARAMAARHAAGQMLGEAFDAAALAHRRAEALDLAGAEQALAAAALPPTAPAEALVAAGYERGVIARQAGDVRTALREIRAAAERAARLGLGRFRVAAEHERALLLRDLGRLAEGEAVLARLDRESPTSDPCEIQDRSANRGWGRLLARETGQDLGDPVPFLVAARDQAASGACPEPHRVLNAALNLALAHLQEARKDGARGGAAAAAAAAELATARRLAAAATGEERLWAGELEARLAAARGDTGEALRRYRALAADARRSGSREALWRSDFGLAGLLCGRGGVDRERAIGLLREAEDLVDRQSLAVPWPGRARFAAQRQAGSALRVGLLLAAGRNEEALRAARRSRARVLRELATETRIERLAGAARERFVQAVGRYRRVRRQCDEAGAEDWRLPGDRLAEERKARTDRCTAADAALEAAVAPLGVAPERGDPDAFPPPAAGELILAYHPLPQGWVAFAADASGVTPLRFDLPGSRPSAARLAELLLAPFHDRLLAARRVRVLAYGALQEVDFHTLPMDGAPLVAARPVVYGLDLPPLTEPETSRVPLAASARALLVADPRGDLPGARREAATVRAALAAGGWSVTALAGAAAGAESTLAALARSDFFHFAGHAAAGSADHGGEILLAGGDRIASAEVLALERVPRQVVLAGCETGLADRDAPTAGLGLAHAFLLRGARQVVAAVRPVPDAATAALFATFYGSDARAADLAVLLARAQAAALAAGHAEAASFRLYEP